MNKITAVRSGSETNVYEPFKDLTSNTIHLLSDMHMEDNIYEKAFKLGFKKLEIGTLKIFLVRKSKTQ